MPNSSVAAPFWACQAQGQGHHAGVDLPDHVQLNHILSTVHHCSRRMNGTSVGTEQ